MADCFCTAKEVAQGDGALIMRARDEEQIDSLTHLAMLPGSPEGTIHCKIKPRLSSNRENVV